MAASIRILIVDDHALVRQGMSRLLQDDDELCVVGEAENGRDAVEMAAELEPDVVLMDHNMPVMNGAEATRELRTARRKTAVIAVSNDNRPDIRQSMEQAGAHGFFLKGNDHRELLAMIHAAASTAGE